ncbi:MAG: DNA polymerase IV [Pyramidobacter sp.]|nr:DNA polymerase IV [Pyramidobacter sp.]
MTQSAVKTPIQRAVIHVDMDAFYAAVEIRDNPALKGRPLIIGALPDERGVVATCSYEARKFGVRSAMNIKEAYRRCPRGIFMHPNREKYRRASARLHAIWSAYADATEYVALDEGYLDVSRSARRFGGARRVARLIKERTRIETGLTCSVGVGYSKTSAKLASEEKKPDGYFEILTPRDFIGLIVDRDITVLYGVGARTAEKLYHAGIYTVRDVQNNRDRLPALLGGKTGRHLAELSFGVDDRPVTPSDAADAKSVSREVTFQKDTSHFGYLRDVLLLLSLDLGGKLRALGLNGRTVTLKATYWNMKTVTRSRSGESVDQPYEIYQTGCALLAGIEKNPVRLIGVGLQNLSESSVRQLTFATLGGERERLNAERLRARLLDLQRRYRVDLRPALRDRTGELLYQLIDLMQTRALPTTPNGA